MTIIWCIGDNFRGVLVFVVNLTVMKISTHRIYDCSYVCICARKIEGVARIKVGIAEMESWTSSQVL